ncbi:hypothetical protein KC887_08135 [Candidatus Kaiserbacteria bacterium]|nr:hypothetical protein [Candidatus Kaiserbacteria bacterium]
MTWPFDDGSAFPVFDGLDVGGQQARTMAERAGGYSGIRTVIEQNPDGSITTLRTRNGNPIYETTSPTSASTQADLYRGFVAKASSRAVLFDPYTLEILNANYTTALNTYTVLDFATSWNVAPDDTTNWFDVALFDGSTIKINGKAMPTLGITANHGFPAIPYVINRETSEDEYGNAERNTTEKRVFAIGRDRVKSWGGGGVTESLTPTAPVSESRAMTIGPRLDFSTDKAWLGQIYHPATGWDGVGEWAFSSAEVTMLLAAGYLTKVSSSADVAMPLTSFGGAVASSGSFSFAQTLPETPITLISDAPYIVFSSQGFRVVGWPWTGTESKEMAGTLLSPYTRETRSGAGSSSVVQSGVTLNYVSSISKYWDVRTESVSVNAQTIPLASHSTTDGKVEAGATTTEITWSSTAEPTRGIKQTFTTGASISGASGAVRNYENQSLESSVTIGGVSIVSFVASRALSFGQMVVVSPNNSYYDPFLANPTGAIGVTFGMGVYSRMTIEPLVPGSIPIYDVYKQNPTPPPQQTAEVLAEIEDAFDTKADEFLAQKLYDNENTSGFSTRNYYYGSIASGVTIDNSTMSWSSKDFILYDETNGVYISIEGEFVGVDTLATLTVSLKVQTRHHTTTQTLGEYNYTYSQLVQEREIGATGKYAMPSPQIRAIFAPLYQEQGSFKGAHYVTEEEEGNGATPAHLFNFVLHLEPYSSIGTINDDNATNATVHFVPCNLLEMLYAFVFSQEYGVAEDGQRYPVTFTTRYNDMMNTLFSTPVRVSVRDGVQGNWSDALGSDFASISTVSLHRV